LYEGGEQKGRKVSREWVRGREGRKREKKGMGNRRRP